MFWRGFLKAESERCDRKPCTATRPSDFDAIKVYLIKKCEQCKTKYFKKGIAVKHKLSYSNFVGFTDQM